MRGSQGAVTTGRRALLGLFGVTGFTLGAWVARLPAVRDALDLSPAQLGSVLLAMAFGSLAAMGVAAQVSLRLGQVRSVRLTGLLYAAAYAVLGAGVATASVPVVVVGLFVHGVAFAGGNLVINVASTVVERRVGRPILPQFHAAFSIGTVLGSLAGAAVAATAVPLLAQLLGMAVLAAAWRWWAATGLLVEEGDGARARLVRGGRDGPADSVAPAARPGADEAPEAQDETPAAPDRLPSLRAAWAEPRTLAVGVVLLVAMVSEGGANNWLALAMVDGLGTTESFAALTLGLFVGAMTLVRLLGSRVIGALGRVRALRFSAATAIAGLVLFTTAPTVALACLGAVAWGAGCALNFPLAVNAASDEPAWAAHRVAVLSAFAAAAAFVEPLGIGALAEAVGVRPALLSVAAALLVVLVLGGRAAPPAAARAAAGEPTSGRGA